MTTSIDLSTTYLGFRLPHPFMASPLVDHLDTVRRLEDAGSAAIVMHSLFEEQITAAQTGRIHHLDPLDKQVSALVPFNDATTGTVTALLIRRSCSRYSSGWLTFRRSTSEDLPCAPT